MEIFPDALKPMKAYKQFIAWQNGKIPIDLSTGKASNAHNPEIWRDAEDIVAAGFPLGFVFADSDPYFFIDIDGCLLPDGEWSPIAKELCGLFTGCAMEVSQSGKGLHIFGRIPVGLPHSNRNRNIHCEFYTQGRFVALTGNGAIGNADFMPDPVIYRNFIEQYFPPSSNSGNSEWTTESREGWSGPEDDGELIKQMLQSKSAKAIFGNGVTIEQLWRAENESLGRYYPDTNGQGRVFDWSAADAALCSHLAFWTGCNCERIERLWGESALAKRDKWLREDYRQSTILYAVNNCREVYKQKQLNSEPGLRSGFQYMAPEKQLELFQKCVYVRDIHKIFIPDGDLLKPEQFKAVYGGYIFALDTIGDKSTRNAWEAFTESQAVNFPKVRGLVFRPELQPGSIINIAGSQYVNSYVPISTPCTDGDVDPFLDFLQKLLPDANDRAILLAYAAACIQYIGVKFQWCPVIQGVQGNGKSFLGECIVQAIGEKYSHIPDSKDLGNVFNAWLSGKLFVLIEEVYTRDRIDTIETLKWMITNRRIPVQAKGRDQVTGDNRANFFMCTNHKDAVQKTEEDRRFCIFYTGQQTVEDIKAIGMGGEYFPKLYEWARNGGYAAVHGYLKRYPIPDALNPATNCHRAPETSSTKEAKEYSLGPVEQLILEAIEEDRTGFRGGWVSSIKTKELLEKKGYKIPNKKYREIMARIGHIAHPGLDTGRTNNRIEFENGKTRLYITKEHIHGKLISAADIERTYCIAQGYIPSE